MLSRRDFLGAGLVGASLYTAGAYAPIWAQNAPNLGTPTVPSPGFRRMKVGDAEVIAVTDGLTRRPLGDEFVKNAPLADVRAMLAAQGLPTDYVDVPYTPFVVVSGGKRILIDTGLGEFGSPATTGKLLPHLQAAGLQASDIDIVLISHFHGDHINGLRNKAGQFVFSKAKVMVPAPEYAFWMDDAKMAAAVGGLKGAFENVRRTFAQMPADMLVRFEPGSELLSGVRSVAAYGHTPGHTMFELNSAGQKFAYLGDLTNIPSLFARNPDWAVVFDMDAEAARKVRRATFERIVADSVTVGGFHFPFPAFGKMKPAETAALGAKGFQFEAVA